MLRTSSEIKPALSLRGDIARWWRAAAAVAIGVALLLVGWFAWKAISKPTDTEPLTEAANVPNDASSLVVRLRPEKLAAAGIRTVAVERRVIQETRRVPGKIGYNASKRLDIKLPASGVVKQVLALPGEQIAHGQPLARLTSIEVGLARDEVIKSEADVQLAAYEFNWAKEIAGNLNSLLAMLEGRPDVSDVEEKFKNKLLGDHRDKVVSAYSRLLLAERAWRGTESMAAKGAISDRLVQERESAREVNTAVYKSVCEQARFEAHQLEVRTRAELEHMQRVLAVNRQKLSLVLGPFAEIADSADEDQLCELVLRSPLDGVVEDRFVSDGVQFVASQALFAVANTDTLWVSAQIYEREWAALADDNAKEVTVEAPALPGQRIQARVKFTAVGLSNETHAVPLVAELPNLDHHFKPGMFAWVTVPVGRKHEALVVPARSVMRQEDEIFVFVELESGVYRKTHVTLGTTGSDLDEVTSGLQPGQNVVDAGAFALKSELVLEGMNE